MQSRVRAHLTSSFNFNTLAAVPFDTADYDELGEFNTSSGTFTAQADGLYLVTAQLYFPGINNHTFGAQIYKGGLSGTKMAASLDYASGADSGSYTAQVTDIVELAAGDTIQIAAAQSSITGQVSANSYNSYVSIHRLS